MKRSVNLENGDRVDFGELREQTQQRLVEFLETDLDLAFTFVRMAQTRRKANARNRLIENARRVLEAVRRFEGRIVDARGLVDGSRTSGRTRAASIDIRSVIREGGRNPRRTSRSTERMRISVKSGSSRIRRRAGGSDSL